jgi:hypothetical protein
MYVTVSEACHFVHGPFETKEDAQKHLRDAGFREVDHKLDYWVKDMVACSIEPVLRP